MTAERWQKIEEIYLDALERPAELRSLFLNEACGPDSELCGEIQSLLELGPGSFLESHAYEATTTTLLGGQIGAYHILSLLGAGGMGEVYRAHDSKLDRDVALKILPKEFSLDHNRLARFRREARTLASLNHPNIATIYGLEESGGPTCLVLELVEGEILRTPLPVDVALDLAWQVAGALEAAHEKGIIHRDLKPSNIKVTPKGQVKVLDFGLAKAVCALEQDGDLSNLRVQTGLETLSGQIVGTPGYMSPEQALGERVDQRTDIWAFGCLLYELLAGKRAFQGDMLQDTIRAVLEREPDWNALPPKTPAKIRELLHRCLQKDASRRLPAIADARRFIERTRTGRNHWVVAAAVAATVLLTGAMADLLRKSPVTVSDPSEWVQLTNFSDSVGQPTLSPDGKMLAFVRGPGTFYTPGQVYLKRLPDGEPRQLTNDDLEKMSPAFSPDGSRIAYTTVDDHFLWDTWLFPTLDAKPKLWLENASGLAWTGKEKVLFSEIRTGQHMALVASQESRAKEHNVYNPKADNGMAHRSYPSPDGKWALVAEMDIRWLPCRIVPVDGSSSGRVVGPPSGACTFAAWSPDGKWMYFTSSANGGFHIWRQRFPSGSPEQITTGPTEQEGIAITPDSRFLITAVGQRQRPLMLHPAGRDRQISLEGYAYQPKFTPDGKLLIYRILKGADVYSDPTQLWVAEPGSGHSEQLLPGFSLFGSGSYDVSADGRRVVVSARDSKGRPGLWLAQLDRRSPPRQIPGVEGDWAVFGEPGEVIFRSTDGFAYRVREDGTGLTKAIEEPVNRVYSISPDKHWLVTSHGKTSIYSLSGGPPVRLPDDILLNWSPDGKRIYLEWGKLGMSVRAAGVTYVIPLSPGEMLPKIIRDGLRSEEDLAKLPGVQVIGAADIAPGPTPDIYAFSREITQRNLFRIPIP
jgi:serine/threonine protein kinase